MFFIKNRLADKSYTPAEVFCGLCVFSVAAFGASVQHVVSTVLALLFVASLFYVRTWQQAWHRLSRYERWVLVGFTLYALSGVLAYYNVEDTREYVKHMGRYIRFAMIVPVYLLLVKYDIRVFKYFMAGIILSGPLFLIVAYMDIQAAADVYWKSGRGAGGQYYQILFGDIAVLNAVIMTAYLLLERPAALMRFIVIVSIFCALYASVLSIARSGWMALMFCVPLSLYVVINKPAINKRRAVPIATVVLTLLVLVVMFSPAEQIIADRVDGVASEIKLFSSGEDRDTSIGRRLALWSVALDVWKKHPIIGTGPGDFDEDFRASQERGLYREVEVHSNVHSVYFQSLATTGTIGFVVLISSLFLLPGILFLRVKRGGSEVIGLTGLCFIASFSVFGLTESWTLRAPFMSMYLAYFVALMSSAPKAENLKESEQKASLNPSAIDEKSLPT